jgi:hypothetical protein
MEDNKTLTGAAAKDVHKYIETLTRRLSYLNERIQLRNNSFDRSERQALQHSVWLLTLELDNRIVLTDEKAGGAADSGNSSVGQVKPTSVIIRRKTTQSGEST